MIEEYFLLVRRVQGIGLSIQEYWDLDTWTTAKLLDMERKIIEEEQKEFNKDKKEYTIEKNAEDKNRKQQIYRSNISKYGQTKGLNIYNHIKEKI